MSDLLVAGPCLEHGPLRPTSNGEALMASDLTVASPSLEHTLYGPRAALSGR